MPGYVPGGRWIPYSTAQVAARRASWLVCWAVPLILAGPAVPPVFVAPPPIAWPPPGAWGPPLPGLDLPWPPAFIPAGSGLAARGAGAADAADAAGFTDTPEPGTLAVLGAALAALALLRRVRLAAAAPQHRKPRGDLGVG
jgi:hypothetical protein